MKLGKGALPSLHRLLEKPPGPESKDAAGRIVRRIVEGIKAGLVAGWTQDKEFQCGRTHYDGDEANRRLMRPLEGIFPSCTFVAARLTCIHRAPICAGVRILGISHRDGEAFEIRTSGGSRTAGLTLGDAAVLARHLKRAGTAAEALEIAKVLIGDPESQATPRPEITFRADDQEGIKIAARLRWPHWRPESSLVLEFDRQGRLSRIGPPPEK